MKLFKISLLAMMALTVGLTACDDDSDYGKDFQTGKPSHGAYFPENLPESYIVPKGQDYVANVQVFRTDLDCASEYTIVSSVDPATDVVIIPEKITFAAGDLETVLPLQLDPQKIEAEKEYTVSLQIGNGTNYGYNTYKFTFKVGEPTVTEEVGTGDFTYANYWTGVDPDLAVTRSYSPGAPNCFTYHVDNWGGGVTLDILVPNMARTDSNGNTIVEVPCQYTGAENTNYGAVYVADVYHYYKDYLQRDDYEGFYGENVYNVNTGLFELRLVYFVPQGNFGADNYEYLQLSGFPDYSVGVSYTGMLTDKNDNIFAIATCQAGKDVPLVKAVMLADDDISKAVEYIQNDGEGVVSIDCNGDPSSVYDLKFPIEQAGDYNITVVSFDPEGKAQSFAYDRFEIVLGGPADAADWKDAGTVDYLDGWIVPTLVVKNQETGEEQPANPEDFPWAIQLEKNIKDGTLRLVQPYTCADCPIPAELNAYPNKKRTVAFGVEGSHAYMLPQPCGFGLDWWKGELQIGTFEGYLMQENPGATLADVVATLENAGKQDLMTVVEDGIMTVQAPFFGAPGIQDGTFGYTWKNMVPTQIILPEAALSARNKAKAARIAAPKIMGLYSYIKAKQMIDHKAMSQVLRSHSNFKPVKVHSMRK